MTPAYGSATLISTGPRALVIDDEPALRVVLRRWLERRGWEVQEAVDGRDAITRLGESDAPGPQSYELVICDLRMPRANGEAVYQWIAAHRVDLLPHLMFASGDVTDESTAAFLIRAGCPVLAKPFELASLSAMVQRASAQQSAA